VVVHYKRKSVSHVRVPLSSFVVASPVVDLLSVRAVVVR